jgi:serine/threonine protein kinase
MEFLKSFDEMTPEFIEKLGKSISETIRPPEDLDKELTVDQIESRDYYALGHLMMDLIAPFLTPAYIQSSVDNMNWKEIQAYVDQCCSRNPSKRISPKSLLDSPFFKNNILIDIVTASS